MARQTLEDICNKHNCDKGTNPDRNTWGNFKNHPILGYSKIYEPILAPHRDGEITFLEIGIADRRFPGASLKVWDEYFTHEEATIFGLDLFPLPTVTEESVRKMFDGRDRIKIVKADQGSSEQILNKIDDSEFDVIIDDGSHESEHIQVSLKTLFPKLKSGGVYIIEDFNTTNHEPYGYKNYEFFQQFKENSYSEFSEFSEDDVSYLEENVESIDIHYVADDKIALAIIYKK